MRTAGSILVQIRDQINEYNADTFTPILLRAVGRAYKDVLGEHMWPETMAMFEPSDALCASLPLLLPANLKRIKSVRDTNYTYYENFNRGNVIIHPYNWYYDTPVQTPLQSGTDASIDAGGTTVTVAGATLGASIVGEYVQIGKNEDVHLITVRNSDTQFTISKALRSADDLANVPWSIRPEGTRYITFCDAAKVAMNPTGLKVEYQRQPFSLIDESDYLLLPDDACDAVFFKSLQYSMQRKGWNNAAAGLEPDYRHKLALAKRESPSSKDSVTPKRMFRRPFRTDILSDRILERL